MFKKFITGLMFFSIVIAALLIAICTEAAEVSLTWKPSMNATGYRVYYGETQDNMNFSVNAGQLTTYIVRRLECGKKYYFYVCAFNDAGESEVSNTASKMMETCPELPTFADMEGWRINGLILTPIE